MNIVQRHPLISTTVAFVAIAVLAFAAMYHHAHTLTGGYTLRLPPVDSFAASSSVELQLNPDGTAQLLEHLPDGKRHAIGARWSIRSDDLVLVVPPNPNPAQSYLMQGGTHIYRRAPGGLTAIGIEREGHLALHGFPTYSHPRSFTFHRDLW